MTRHLSISKDGYLQASGLREGSYVLTIKDPVVHVLTLTVVLSTLPDDVSVRLGFVGGPEKLLQLPAQRSPVTIAAVKRSRDSISIRVGGGEMEETGRGVRVHVVASRFVPQSGLESLVCDSFSPLQTQTRTNPTSFYLPARQLGEEHKYILERQAKRQVFPGNSLTRPSLLLNPWAVGDTSTNKQVAAQGTDHAR